MPIPDLRGGTSDIGVRLSDWKNLGLKVEHVEPGSIADMEDYFQAGDGILEIDQIQLNSGTFNFRQNVFYERSQRTKFIIRIVTKDKIQEIESLDSRCVSLNLGNLYSEKYILYNLSNTNLYYWEFWHFIV